MVGFSTSVEKDQKDNLRNLRFVQKRKFIKDSSFFKRAFVPETSFSGIRLFSLARFCVAPHLNRQRPQYHRLNPDKNYEYFTYVGDGITATAPMGH